MVFVIIYFVLAGSHFLFYLERATLEGEHAQPGPGTTFLKITD